MFSVLVTGAAGAIGEPVCRELSRRGHRVRGFDLRQAPFLDDHVVGDLTDRALVQRAMQGMDTLVHLGARPDDAPFDELLGPNVRGLFHVLDAARSAGARRVVLASSIQVVFGREPGSVAQTTDRLPTNHYALTKVWAEDMGEMYARCFGLSVIAARICFMVRDRGEAEYMVRTGAEPYYLSRADTARFFALAVEAREIGFEVLYAAGPRGAEVVDLESARRVIGYQPEDAWPSGLPEDAAEFARSLAATRA